MAVTIEQIKELKRIANVGLADCKAALEESNGDLDIALEVLRKRGMAKLAKRADKVAEAGLVGTYLHNGVLLGVAVVNCETDFVAKNADFVQFAKDLAMQVCSQAPTYVSIDDVPTEMVEKEKELFMSEMDGSKPKEIMEKMLEGKIQKLYEQICLLEQSWIKDDSKKIKDLYNELAAKTGEKIVIKSIYRITI